MAFLLLALENTLRMGKEWAAHGGIAIKLWDKQSLSMIPVLSPALQFAPGMRCTADLWSRSCHGKQWLCPDSPGPGSGWVPSVQSPFS